MHPPTGEGAGERFTKMAEGPLAYGGWEYLMGLHPVACPTKSPCQGDF